MAPSQSDAFDDRPVCQSQWVTIWPAMAFSTPSDNAYRRLYYWLHKLVDAAIGAVLDALDASGLADNTIVVFTSDHGDLLGAHGGMQQKWYNAYDEAIRVPLIVLGPGISPDPVGVHVPTSHVDLVPTLLGLAGVDPGELQDAVVVRDPAARADTDTPIYFMTEDQISVGPHMTNPITRAPFTQVSGPANIESVIATLPTGSGGARELWKFNRYEAGPDDADPEATFTEVHNLSTDPEERHNLAQDPTAPIGQLQALLDVERATKRLTPRWANPPAPTVAALRAARP